MLMKDHSPVELVDVASISRDEWLLWRRTGLGGSDAAPAAGISPFSSPLRLWGEKLGINPAQEMTEAMYWGIVHEDNVAARFAENHPELDVWNDTLMYRHPDPDLEWLLANTDRRIGADGLLEVKTADKDARFEWFDGPPDYYMLQIQHYLCVLGLRWAWVCVLIGGNHYREFFVERDDDLIDTVVGIERKFWVDHVLARVPPPAIGVDDEASWLTDTYPGQSGSTIMLPPEGVEAWHYLRDLREQIAGFETEKTRVEDELKLIMGDAAEAIDPDTGKTLITWKPHVARKFDQKGFEAKSPHLYRCYQVDSPARPFLFKDPDKKKKGK